MEKEDEATSEIHELKEELKALRHQNAEGENVQEGLKEAIHKLIKLFETGIEYVKKDTGESLADAVKQMNTLSEDMKKLLSENTVIAKGMVKLTSAVEGLSQQLISLELSAQRIPDVPHESEEEEGDEMPPPPPKHPKHRMRKKALDMFKEEFSK